MLLKGQRLCLRAVCNLCILFLGGQVYGASAADESFRAPWCCWVPSTPAILRWRNLRQRVSHRAPMSFFHTTPLGRIINRLTKDTVDADKNLADFAAFFLRSMLQLISTIVLIGIVTPLALPALLPIMLLFYFLYSYFQVPVPACICLGNPCRSPHSIYNSVYR